MPDMEAIKAVLRDIVAEMDEEDKRHIKAKLMASADEDSEEPINPKNLDLDESEAEEEGGHPGMVAAADVDDAEEQTETDEDKRRKKILGG